MIKQTGIDPKNVDNQQKQQLNLQARQYKQKLTDNDSVTVDININGVNYQGELNNQIIADVIKPVTDRTLSVCEQVLRDANLTKADLHEVVLVGGSTRMPVIQQLVAKTFDKNPLLPYQS